MVVLMNIPRLKQRTNWTSEVLEVLQPGLELYGYCCGYFGRDSYGIKIIKDVRVVTWDIDSKAIELTVVENNCTNICTLKSLKDVINLVESSNSDKNNEAYF